MEWLIVVVVALALVVILKKSNKSSNVRQQVRKEVKQEVKQSNFPYKKVQVLFSPAERSFLGVLENAVGDGVKVFGKVRVADVVLPENGLSRSNWQQAFNKISGKHFDYLLCNKDDLSVIFAIELDDSSHQTEGRAKRDEFLSGVCDAADIPLVQVPAKKGYMIAEIKGHLKPYIDNSDTESIETNSSQSQGEEKDTLCPKCSSIMVQRMAKKGSNAGKQFWGCSAFPKCRYIQIAGIATAPNGAFMQQVARNLTDVDDGFLLNSRYLIMDRDTKYTDAFRAHLDREGVKPVRCPARAPNCNAFAERFVRSIKDECLDRMILFGEASLRRALREYDLHYKNVSYCPISLCA